MEWPGARRPGRARGILPERQREDGDAIFRRRGRTVFLTHHWKVESVAEGLRRWKFHRDTGCPVLPRFETGPFLWRFSESLHRPIRASIPGDVARHLPGANGDPRIAAFPAVRRHSSRDHRDHRGDEKLFPQKLWCSRVPGTTKACSEKQRRDFFSFYPLVEKERRCFRIRSDRSARCIVTHRRWEPERSVCGTALRRQRERQC